jgi:hypothetical protein
MKHIKSFCSKEEYRKFSSSLNKKTLLEKQQERFEELLTAKRRGDINLDILWDAYNESNLLIAKLFEDLDRIDHIIFKLREWKLS